MSQRQIAALSERVAGLSRRLASAKRAREEDEEQHEWDLAAETDRSSPWWGKWSRRIRRTLARPLGLTHTEEGAPEGLPGPRCMANRVQLQASGVCAMMSVANGILVSPVMSSYVAAHGGTRAGVFELGLACPLPAEMDGDGRVRWERSLPLNPAQEKKAARGFDVSRRDGIMGAPVYGTSEEKSWNSDQERFAPTADDGSHVDFTSFWTLQLGRYITRIRGVPTESCGRVICVVVDDALVRVPDSRPEVLVVVPEVRQGNVVRQADIYAMEVPGYVFAFAMLETHAEYVRDSAGRWAPRYISGRPGNHALVGLRCEGQEWVVDSNGFAFREPWSSPELSGHDLAQAFEDAGGKTNRSGLPRAPAGTGGSERKRALASAVRKYMDDGVVWVRRDLVPEEVWRGDPVLAGGRLAPVASQRRSAPAKQTVSRCAATTRVGERCKRWCVSGGSGVCSLHSAGRHRGHK